MDKTKYQWVLFDIPMPRAYHTLALDKLPNVHRLLYSLDGCQIRLWACVTIDLTGVIIGLILV